MANQIVDDGTLTELDVKLVPTSTHPLIKVNNPPSSRVPTSRGARSVLTIIRERGAARQIVVKKGKLQKADGATH